MLAEARTFATSDLLFSAWAAVCIQVGFFLLLVFAGQHQSVPPPEPEVPKKPMAIAVKPVLDELPLLKLGSKRVRAKLPDMWKKQAPVKRYEERSAPSVDAKKTPDAIPTSKVATKDAEAPPPDAEIAKKVDEEVDASPDAEAPNLAEEGAADGVKEGTETDPLKAFRISQYRMKVIRWFNRRFNTPKGELTCEQLKGLRATAVANLGPNRTVTGYSITSPSGNAVFDARVRAALDSARGQQLPPPGDQDPELLKNSTINVAYSGKHPDCK